MSGNTLKGEGIKPGTEQEWNRNGMESALLQL